jgi:hypothetical protein
MQLALAPPVAFGYPGTVQPLVSRNQFRVRVIAGQTIRVNPQVGLLLLLGLTWGAAAESFFPLGVWLQNPTNAPRFRAAGINTYVGLWQGPTVEQLTTLQSAGLRVVCFQNEVALRHPSATNIIAWMHPDEPDNVNRAAARLGFGAPTDPEQVVMTYRRIKTADPTRPVFLNLGQGVAWDNWYGRGNRNRHPEDYPRYLEGCDIASFDLYPVNHPAVEVAGNLWYVPRGIERLRGYTRDAKPVWNFIECTAIDRPNRKPTPVEVRAEVWLSIIHGSRGLVYFAHQFQPRFREAALLDDAEMLTTITALNREITALAPALAQPTLAPQVTYHSTNPALPIATLVKHHAGAMYLFAAGLRPLRSEVEFVWASLPPEAQVEVLGEDRTLTASQGRFTDQFTPWQVHLYRVNPAVRPTNQSGSDLN